MFAPLPTSNRSAFPQVARAALSRHSHAKSAAASHIGKPQRLIQVSILSGRFSFQLSKPPPAKVHISPERVPLRSIHIFPENVNHQSLRAAKARQATINPQNRKTKYFLSDKLGNNSPIKPDNLSLCGTDSHQCTIKLGFSANSCFLGELRILQRFLCPGLR